MKKKLILALLVGLMLPCGYAHAQTVSEAQAFLDENMIEVPEEIEELCEHYGERNGIAPELLEAVIWKESRFKKGVVNDTHTCVGLMQINTDVHSKRMRRLKVTNMFDPAANIAVGSDYLGELLEDNPVEVALMLYNGDSSAYRDDYISKYARSVLRISEALERVNKK